jgi:hypothetical protein
MWEEIQNNAKRSQVISLPGPQNSPLKWPKRALKFKKIMSCATLSFEVATITLPNSGSLKKENL